MAQDDGRRSVALGTAGLTGTAGAGPDGTGAQAATSAAVAQAPPVAPDRVVLTTGEDRLHGGAPNQGWWSNSRRNHSRNDSYTVGGCRRDEHRSFFTFSLADLRAPVVAARLEVFAATLEGARTERLRLHDVSTPARRLNANDVLDLDVWRDLGTGARYGSYVIDTEKDERWLRLPLSRKAVRDLERARGRWFSLGARLVAPSCGTELFAWSHDRGLTARLVLRTAAG